jgi:hypothetical protein
MKIYKTKHFIFLCFLVCCISCAGRNVNVFTPVPDFSIYDANSFININDITENRRNMPQWLLAYINGGVEEVEKLDTYNNRYVFIAVNEGTNFTILNKWAENISARFDFPILAALRIEERMISTASLYPDDEYGAFFETLIKNAYNSSYPGTAKEEHYWIKIRTVDENLQESTEKYMFFVLLSIDRSSMQTIIRNMMSRTAAAVNLSGHQVYTVNRLRQIFFEGF